MWWAELLNSLSTQLGAAYNLPVAGAYLWLDSSVASSFTFSSGSVVSRWKDISGNNHSFTTAAVANQPSRSGTQNSLSTVVFDGTNDYLKVTSSAATWKYMHDGTPNTLFVVMKNTAPETVGTPSSRWALSTTLTEGGFQINFDTFYSPIQIEASIEGFGSGKFLQNDRTIPNTGHNVYSFILDPNNATDNEKLVEYQNTGSALPPTFVFGWVTDTTNSGTPL